MKKCIDSKFNGLFHLWETSSDIRTSRDQPCLRSGGRVQMHARRRHSFALSPEIVNYVWHSACKTTHPTDMTSVGKEVNVDTRPTIPTRVSCLMPHQVEGVHVCHTIVLHFQTMIKTSPTRFVTTGREPGTFSLCSKNSYTRVSMKQCSQDWCNGSRSHYT